LIANYEAIDWQIVHVMATRHMEDFAAFAMAAVASVEA